MRWKWGTPLTLETENYILSSIDPKNIPDELIAWYADKETMVHMNDMTDLNRDQLAELFSSFDNKYKFALLARSKMDNAPVGIFRIFLEPKNSKADTSVLVGNKDYWGKNAVIEIRTRILDFLFTALKLNKVCGSIRARNFPALFNYTKQGFAKEGILKQQVCGRDGTFEDVVIFGMLRDTWLEKRNKELRKQQEGQAI